MKFFVKGVLSFVLLFCLILPLFACGLIEQPDSKKEPWSNAANPPSTTGKEKTPEELIVGTWILESQRSFYDGEEQEEYYAPESPVVFLADGSLLGGLEEDEFARWQIQDNSLVLTYFFADEPEIITTKLTLPIIKLDKDYLVLRYDASSDSDLHDGEYVDDTYRRQGD